MIKEIIKNQLIDIHFQPIISINRQKVFGVEALVRGEYDGKMISPYILFKMAKEEGLTLTLDKLARKKSLEKFSKLYQKDKALILFLNFESALIDKDFSTKEFDFNKRAKQLRIPPKNIALEIKEDEINSDVALMKFCSKYRQYGFNIAIDDFGVGRSSFDRLSIVKPDIIKIDRSILQDIHKDHTKKEILKAITNMSRNIGARVLAEGVEKEKEILEAMKIGINTFQGFWFAKPCSEYRPNVESKIIKVGNTLKDEKVKEQLKNIKLNRKSEKIADKIIKTVGTTLQGVDETLLSEDKSVEAIYFIDLKSAKQIGKTLITTELKNLYEPTKDKEDHSYKEYYYITKESKTGSFLTSKYISYASGNMCRTFAKRFKLNAKREVIICIDLVS